MQNCTGIVDKNNTEICVGDKVKIISTDEVGIVGFGIAIVHAEDNYETGEALCFYIELEDYKVALGNRFYDWYHGTVSNNLEILKD